MTIPKYNPNFSNEDLESLKMHIVHSTTGWNKDNKPNVNTKALLQKIDFSLGEKDVYDNDYGYVRGELTLGKDDEYYE